ncbi:hypothetical protein KUCAC02_030024, partial [Chaenocephalus aceratus]
MSVQTDMDKMIRAIAVDHTYSSNSKKDASASTQPQPSPVSSAAQSFNSPAEPVLRLAETQSFTNRNKWVAKAVKVPKKHCYREDMMRDVVLMRTHGLEKSHVQLPEVNPNMFDIEKPEKSEVVNATLQNTRFRK